MNNFARFVISEVKTIARHGSLGFKMELNVCKIIKYIPTYMTVPDIFQLVVSFKD